MGPEMRSHFDGLTGICHDRGKIMSAERSGLQRQNMEQSVYCLHASTQRGPSLQISLALSSSRPLFFPSSPSACASTFSSLLCWLCAVHASTLFPGDKTGMCLVPWAADGLPDNFIITRL